MKLELNKIGSIYEAYHGRGPLKEQQFENIDGLSDEVMKQISDGTLKIHLGCGPDCEEGYLGIDNEIYEGVDILSNSWMWDKIPFPDNSCSEVLLYDVIQFIHQFDALRLMEECWRLLSNGGLLKIRVPSHEGATSVGPQICSAWSPYSFVCLEKDDLRTQFRITGKFKIVSIEKQVETMIVGGLQIPDIQMSVNLQAVK